MVSLISSRGIVPSLFGSLGYIFNKTFKKNCIQI
jgi:hypothetical protein